MTSGAPTVSAADDGGLPLGQASNTRNRKTFAAAGKRSAKFPRLRSRGAESRRRRVPVKRLELALHRGEVSAGNVFEPIAIVTGSDNASCAGQEGEGATC